MSRRRKKNPASAGPISKKEKLALAYQELARLRQVERSSIAECAAALGVSERTINNYLASEEYKAFVETYRADVRESAMTQVASYVQEALEVLRDLMRNDKSGHVRFEAAKELKDTFGLSYLEKDMEQTDDREELDRLTRILAARPQQVNVYQLPPEPGGFLPAPFRPSDQPPDADYLAARLKNPVIDAEKSN